MPKWLMPMMVMVAIGCARTSVKAQPAEPAPTPEPPQAQQDDEQQQLEERLKALAEREQALAARRAAQAEGAAERARDAMLRAQVRLGAQVKKEKAAWLGVSTDRVSPALRRHVQLKYKGIGLIVERVEPKSPAEDAGLQQYDILEKLDDQWLVNSEQFGVLIRMHNPGDEVTLTVIRQGQPQQIKAKLAEKELPVLGMAGDFGWAGAFAVPPIGDIVVGAPELKFTPLMVELGQLAGDTNTNVVISDPEHTLKITTKDGKRNLVASDANGVVIFDGPIDTEEQRAMLPEEIEKKLEKFDDMPGIYKLRRAAPATAPSDEED